MSLHKNNFGQATVEYLLILSFILIISLKLVDSFTEFMVDNIGSLGHVMSYNLSVGVCNEECFYDGYKNGFKSQ